MKRILKLDFCFLINKNAKVPDAAKPRKPDSKSGLPKKPTTGPYLFCQFIGSNSRHCNSPYKPARVPSMISNFEKSCRFFSLDTLQANSIIIKSEKYVKKPVLLPLEPYRDLSKLVPAKNKTSSKSIAINNIMTE